jgi:biotin carboxyl carrier protein
MAAVSPRIQLGDGPARDVAVTRSGERAHVHIDGSCYDTTATPEAGATVIEADGLREAVWTAVDRDTVHVHAFGRSWSLVVTDQVEGALGAGVWADAAVAVMPGVVVSVTVGPGETVSQGQVVAVIESMKMHSDVTAPRDGIVDRVLVALGDTFDEGAALVTLVADGGGDAGGDASAGLREED